MIKDDDKKKKKHSRSRLRSLRQLNISPTHNLELDAPDVRLGPRRRVAVEGVMHGDELVTDEILPVF